MAWMQNDQFPQARLFYPDQRGEVCPGSFRGVSLYQVEFVKLFEEQTPRQGRRSVQEILDYVEEHCAEPP